MSWALFAHQLTMNFAIGVSIVFISMHQFFTFGDKAGKGHAGAEDRKMLYSPSMDQISVAAATVAHDNGLVYSREGITDRAALLPR